MAVMIVLDAFEMHTPNRIASYSPLLIFFVFVIHNVWLGTRLKRITNDAKAA